MCPFGRPLRRARRLLIAVLVIGWSHTAYAACGDGTVDAGEQCDDGVAANGTAASCCAADCTFQVFLTACTPGSPLSECVQAVCDGAGTCGLPLPPFSPCTDSTPGDCFAAECDGAGTCNQTAVALPSFTACTPSSPLSECMVAACDGTGTCGLPGPLGPCTDTTPGDCFQAQCGAGGTCDQSALPQPPGTTCTDTIPGDCHVAQCTATGACDQSAALQPTGTTCEDTTPSDCFAAQCTAAGACNQTAAPQGLGAACGNQAATECDQADTCNGGGQCQANFVAAGTACTDTDITNCFASQCDGSGTCNQTAKRVPCPAPPLSKWGLIMSAVLLSLAGWLTLQRSQSRARQTQSHH
jgi:hypothetical protein